MVSVQRRQHSVSQISNYNSCTGHKHGQTSSRSAACVAVRALMLGSQCTCAWLHTRLHLCCSVVHGKRQLQCFANKHGVSAFLLHASEPLCTVSEPVKCLQMYLSPFTDSAMRALGFGIALPLAQQIQMAALETCCLHQTSLSLECISERAGAVCVPHNAVCRSPSLGTTAHTCFASSKYCPAAFFAQSYTMSQACFMLLVRIGPVVLCCDATRCGQFDLIC